MKTPTGEQHRDMLDVLAQSHAWIDTMQIAGLSENVIVSGVHQAILERLVRAGGVAMTAEWLQSRADMVAGLGHELLAELQKQGR